MDNFSSRQEPAIADHTSNDSSVEQAALQREIWSDGKIVQSEAEALTLLAESKQNLSPQWVDMAIDALTDYIVYRQTPRGYVSEQSAQWLIAQIERDGVVDSMFELELLVRIAEVATSAPEALKNFALRSIETTVLNGTGPTRKSGEIIPGRIDDAEVALLRRLIFAQAGDDALIVSADEADMLFRLKDATLHAVNAAGWQDLFVKAVGNHLMAYSSYTPMAAERVLAHEAWVADTRTNIGGFLSRVIQNSPHVFAALSEWMNADEVEAAKARAKEAEAQRASHIDVTEKRWLDKQVAADGTTDDLERALIAFIEQEKGRI